VESKKKNNHNSSFKLKDCVIVMLSTGYRAQNLREFRNGLTEVHPDSIYHHFWGRFLQPSFDEPEYNNDFASWVVHGLNEKALAERLSTIDPAHYPDVESLRSKVIETVEERLDESEYVTWSGADQQFHFLRSKLIILDIGLEVHTPEELGKAIKDISLGSIYFHFIDARRRTESHKDDYTEWLAGLGKKYKPLINSIQAIDPYFSSLKMIRRSLVKVFEDFGLGNRKPPGDKL